MKELLALKSKEFESLQAELRAIMKSIYQITDNFDIEDPAEFVLVCRLCGLQVAHSSQVDVIKNVYERRGMTFYRRTKDTMSILIDKVVNLRYSKKHSLLVDVEATEEPEPLQCKRCHERLGTLAYRRLCMNEYYQVLNELPEHLPRPAFRPTLKRLSHCLDLRNLRLISKGDCFIAFLLA